VSRLWGVGRKTAPKLHALGLNRIGDVAAADVRYLIAKLGSAGSHFHDLAHARDPRRVRRGRAAKSIGSDRTLSQDVSRREDIEIHLLRSADRIARRLRNKDYVAGGVRVRLKTSQFEMMSRQCQLKKPADTAEVLFQTGRRLLRQFDHPGPFRLVGMAAFDLGWRNEPRQLDFFEDTTQRNLETSIDDLIERFGKKVVMRARDLGRSAAVMTDGVNLDFLDHRDGERVSSPGK